MTKETLLSHITDRQIFERFFGEFKESKLYQSPLRTDDKNPSFNIFYSQKKNCYLFKDLGGDGGHGTCFDFVTRMTGVTFPEVLKLIAGEFGLSEEISYNKSKPKTYSKPENNIFLRSEFWYEEKPFPEFGDQIWFWEKIGITKEFLDEYHVKNIKWYSYINSEGKKITVQSRVHDPIYLYDYENNGEALRFYQPNAWNKKNKFRGNIRFFDIFGLKQLKENFEKTGQRVPLCGILAGQKDALAVYANTGIRCVAAASESTAINDDEFEEIQKYSDFQFVMYDPDKAGYMYGKKLAYDFQIPFIDIKDMLRKYPFPMKDPANYYEYILKEKLKDKLKPLIYAGIYC
jgi:hypothetical protein